MSSSSLLTTLKQSKGVVGLKNLGNSCFMNSLLQCLSQIDEFNTMRSREGTLFREWLDLKQLMWQRYSIISPNRFHFLVQEAAKKRNMDTFSGYAQNDINEFLNFLIDCFHEDTKRPVTIEISGNANNELDEVAKVCYEMMKNMYEKEHSDMIKLLYGIHITFGHSSQNEVLRRTPEPFFTIFLPIPNRRINDIYDCFDLYTQKEELDEDNKWLNPKTGEKEVIQNSLQFFTLPDILIITLKRFNNHGRKTNAYVSYPIEDLSLEKYVHGYNKNLYRYDLFGVCNHSGSLSGGHYTAFIKNKTCGFWTLMNDSIVSIVNEKDVVSNKAYCLFYRKRRCI